ncbi:MAG: lamin tail domain-containing protein, partial [Verrucomicrobiales bacterium]|nr:lamin tail domain-containing protein [Verrucomicrobiales bacterium]
WAERRIGELDSLKRQGWEWFASHAGLGSSAELTQPGLVHDSGLNWASSLETGGTPGRANSTATTNIAPIIRAVAHHPPVPRSTDPIAVSAQMMDEAPVTASIAMHWRVDGAPGFVEVGMMDDGQHGDGLASDGRWGAVIPPQASGTVVEFYFVARDEGGRIRAYPNVQPSGGSRTANFVFQVDDTVYAGVQPVMRLVMAKAEFDYLDHEVWGGEPRSDALVSGTFVHSDGVLDGGTSVQTVYLCGFRNRGHGTRTAVPHNFHVAFPKDHPWKGRTGLTLNTHYTHSQQIGSAIFRRLQIPMAESRPVQVRVNGQNLAKPGQEQFGSYAANELIDDRLVKGQFPNDPEGNLYRGIRDIVPGVDSEADLAWHGPDFTSYTNAYSKENHRALNDWSDFIRLVDVLNNTPDDTYVETVRQHVDVDQWMRYFAANALLGNQENSLANGAGDDFVLYRGTRDARFRLMPYDMDAILGRGTRTASYLDGIWRMTNVAVIHRFMKRPEFVPLYFHHLRTLATTAFKPAELNPVLDHLLQGYVDGTALANLKTFGSNQVAHVLSQIPSGLTVVHDLSTNSGIPRTTSAVIGLRGVADAVTTRRVQVNGSPANWTAWRAEWSMPQLTLLPGLRRILVQAFGEDGRETERATLEVWYDDGTVQSVAGTIDAETHMTAAGGPYRLNSTTTIQPGATLVIEPGTTIYLGANADLVVANGGRLLAEGTGYLPIRFASVPGSGTRWGGVVIQGGANSPETRVSHAFFDGNQSTAIHSVGGTVLLEHLGFGATDQPYLSLDGSSFVVRDCVFPSGTDTFELVHGTGGVKAGGQGLFLRNLFGVPIGYNDVVDFTGGNRPGQPIVEFINNVFLGATDDELDLDGTDAWVEGNLFLHVHKNGSPDSASAVSGGSNGSNESEVTLLGNLFYDCDQAATAKQGNFYTLIHNTIVRQTKTGGLDTDAGVVNFADEGTTEGAGMVLAGNIIVDAEKLTRDMGDAAVVFSDNLLPLPWAGPGTGNSLADPMLRKVPSLNDTFFDSFEAAQVLREWLAPAEGSPAIRSGLNRQNRGGVVPLGVWISGEPEGTTADTTATLTMGPGLVGGGIPTGGWPLGSGYTHYRFRLDGGPWSAERSISESIRLENLADGSHQVEVVGKRDSGRYQDDPILGSDARVTASKVWIVDRQHVPTPAPPVKLHEILARNTEVETAPGNTEDLIELWNRGTNVVDLSGLGLSDGSGNPNQFRIPIGTTLGPGAFLVLAAGNGVGGPFPHTGFALRQEGDRVVLYDRQSRGSVVLDVVEYGPQIANASIGRRTDGTWGLCRPTFGSPNEAIALGDPRRLRINEWLADAQFSTGSDFVELFNPDTRPVALEGVFLTDAAGDPERHSFAALSYIAAEGYLELIADGAPSKGGNHLGFRLSPDAGMLALSSRDSGRIDAITYASQRTDVAEGRSPDGADGFASFLQPTPGGGNPGRTTDDCTLATTTVVLLPRDARWRYQQTENLDGTGWQSARYDDQAWLEGPALLGVENDPLPAPGRQTTLSLGRTTYYFRTQFQVGASPSTEGDHPLEGYDLNLTMAVDDGVILYLNGEPILTNGLPAGPVTYATVANRTVSDATWEFYTLRGLPLNAGTNVLAAEVHQVNATSSDIVWGLGLEATRTFTNCEPSTLTTLALNEVLADNRSAEGPGVLAGSDYVELHHAGTNRLDLAGLGLTDDPAFPRKWTFPSGTMLEPGGYLVVQFNGALPASATNTGFGLGARGGGVFLFNRSDAGGQLLDGVRYGVQAADFAIGRIPSGSGPWNLVRPSPGATNALVPLGDASSLSLNEWMADPVRGPDWIEIHNPNNLPVALGGLALTDDLSNPMKSPIAPLSFIGVGGSAFLQFYADDDVAAGPDHLAFALKRSGESLALFSASGELLDGLAFEGQSTGVSEGRLPDGADRFARFPATSSPAEPNWLPLNGPVINEVLTHADPPLEDAIELFNPTSAAIDMGGWYLSHSRHDPRQYRFSAGTIIGPGEYRVVYQAQFGVGPAPFQLNSAHGDEVVLAQSDASGTLSGYRDVVQFGAAANGVSFGRIPIRTGVDFAALEARTFGEDNPSTIEQFRQGTGGANAAPRVGPVVITEIFYSPTDGTAVPMQVEDEFIELENISGGPVAFYDADAPTNTWRLWNAVHYEFPGGIVLHPGERGLVVGFSPDDTAHVAAFRSRWNVPAATRMFGPWAGRLGNDGDSVELDRPDRVQEAPHPDAGFVPRLLVDRVRYLASAPWPPVLPDEVRSIHRLQADAYGNDAAHWMAGVPTPGRARPSDFVDVDADGLEDAWEERYFGSLARDGSGDADTDRMTDRAEFQAGTSPVDPADRLALNWVSTPAGSTLGFHAVAGRRYEVQSTDVLGEQPWQRVAEIGPVTATGLELVAEAPGGGTPRYYRLRLLTP